MADAGERRMAWGLLHGGRQERKEKKSIKKRWLQVEVVAATVLGHALGR